MLSSPRPLSVVHVLAPARFGGAETVVLALAKALHRNGDRVCVALVLDPEGDMAHPLAAALHAAEVDVVPVVVPRRGYLRERRAVREILELRDADVLHTHGYRPDVIDAGVARRMSIPTVTTVHGFTGGGWRGRLYERAQRRAFRRFDAVIAVSDAMSQDLRICGVDPGRLHTVRNAFPSNGDFPEASKARERLGLPVTGQRVGWVGRMTPEKAPDVMVRAAALVSHPTVSFSLIGGGPMEAECRELADKLGVRERIRWHGAVPSAGAMLKAFDALVLSSWTEGTPMILLEAMAAGVPIVTTEVGGIPDMLSTKEALLSVAGSAEGIAVAIDTSLGDPSGAQSRVAAAKRRLETDFAVGPWLAQHRSIYQSVVDGR